MKPGLASLLDDMPKEPPDMSAVMAAKAKIESLMQKSGDLATPAAGGGSSAADASGAKSASSKGERTLVPRASERFAAVCWFAN